MMLYKLHELNDYLLMNDFKLAHDLISKHIKEFAELHFDTILDEILKLIGDIING